MHILRWRLLNTLTVALLAALAASCDSKPADGKVGVRIVVTVPEQTDRSETIYLSGSLPELGNWSGKGLAMTGGDGRTRIADVRVAPGTTLEFKVTRGSWETVEKGPNGEEISNHKLVADKDQTISITVAAWRDAVESPQRSTVTGELRYHRQFHSKTLGNDRTVLVWLPPGYDTDPTKRYPVLYMHDGQNLFDELTSFAGEWRADETATALIAQQKIAPLIIVGIENTGPARVDEYTPTAQPIPPGAQTFSIQSQPTEGGKGERYARFLIEEVKPFIDREYRTLSDRDNTGVAGASLGGLISLYLIWQHGDVFGKCAAVSPSLWWDKRKMLIAFETDNTWMRREKIWIDMGTDEATTNWSAMEILSNSRELHAIMLRAGLEEGKDFAYREFDGAGHNEQAWSDRFDQVLLFLFGR